MSNQERRDITNAIWLCRNCHKLVDADPLRFPAELLFEWRRSHEDEITKRLGKLGDALRLKVISRELSTFKSCSYLAQQIVIDKPPHWEYKLTVELLRSLLDPVLSRWKDLEGGCYAKRLTIVSVNEVVQWHSARMQEIEKLVLAFSRLVERELQTSWGPPGQPGKPNDILRVCHLVAECAEKMLEWEEDVRFTIVPSNFDEVHELLSGVAGRMLAQFDRIPTELGANITQEHPSGFHYIPLVIDLPDGWVEKVSAAVDRVKRGVTQH